MGPEGVTCEHCVLQWHYTTGNSPGHHPEEFINCADIKIKKKALATTCNEDGGEREMTVEGNKEETVSKPEPEPSESETEPETESEDEPETESWTGESEEWESETTSEEQCKSGFPHIPDSWCMANQCAQVYIDSGHCVLIEEESDDQSVGQMLQTLMEQNEACSKSNKEKDELIR